MWGLIKKDLIVIKKTTSVINFIALFPVLLAGISNPTFFLLMLSAALSMLLGIPVLNTMAYDEKINWRKNIRAFPIKSSSEAGSKYCIMGMLAVINFGVTFIGGWFASVVFLNIVLEEVLLYAFGGTCVVILYNIVVIPLAYRFGCDKVRYLLILLLAIPYGVGALSSYFDLDMNTIANISKNHILVSICVLLLGSTMISFFISKIILEKIQ